MAPWGGELGLIEQLRWVPHVGAHWVRDLRAIDVSPGGLGLRAQVHGVRLVNLALEAEPVSLGDQG